MQPLNLAINIPVSESCKECSCCFPKRKKSQPIDIPTVKLQRDNLMAEIRQKVFKRI